MSHDASDADIFAWVLTYAQLLIFCSHCGHYLTQSAILVAYWASSVGRPQLESNSDSARGPVLAVCNDMRIHFRTAIPFVREITEDFICEFDRIGPPSGQIRL